ncbi:hypothetical protein GL50803_0061026 [Giardia duodenalis]|uniref:MIF4G domain-containing protein n=2 Tax=Giardia intestinalis TaxID=5741 RepID=A0A644F244_GIAIC|nr:hypothetical protein GL50803_0061026 [Giardia intestinalis]ESU35618.1 Hypothetical protein DHA2_153603 [Giardia intestinalis]KAE8302696.1 hypothetical protein GL50803_0061026 [Giardia intestinalis]
MTPTSIRPPSGSPQIARSMILGMLSLNKNEDLCCQIIIDCIYNSCFIDFHQFGKSIVERLASVLNPRALSKQQYSNLCNRLKEVEVTDPRLIHMYRLDKQNEV